MPSPSLETAPSTSGRVQEWWHRSRCCRPAFLSQIAKETLKRLVITVRIFPIAEIADMPSSTQLRCPRGVRRRDGIVQPNRKEREATASLFGFEGRLNF